MGDGPSFESEKPKNPIGQTPWTEDPRDIPSRYSRDGQPTNPLDAQRHLLYPDEVPRGSDTRILKVPPAEPFTRKLDVSESFTQPDPITNLKEPPDDSALPTVPSFSPTSDHVRAEASRFWNGHANMAQVAWHGYKLFPHQPWPKLPTVFISQSWPKLPPLVFPLKPDWKLVQHEIKTCLDIAKNDIKANWQNYTSKKLMGPVTEKFGPIGTAGGAFVAEWVIDSASGLDKNEFQTGRLIADFFGPKIVMGTMCNSWWKKGLMLVGTHTAGRYFDLLTETPMKKWMRHNDE